MRQHFCTVAILSACFGQVCAQTWVTQSSSTTASLRGVSAVDSLVAWASGSGGTYLRTVDGGAVWHTALVPGAADLDFRAVHALDGNTAWLMSSGPGGKSKIYKTADGGAHWALLYTNPDAAGFFDSLAFWDRNRGVALGDPVDGQFVILTTADGGRTWQRRPTPPALPNEGAFAASNSCLLARGKREIWFATGGGAAVRVFHSPDAGQTWSVTAAPSSGIYSLAFAGRLLGIAVGGDYTRPGDSQRNIAITDNGGRKWLDPSGTHPHGYRSAVAYLASRQAWIAVGTSGSDLSSDGGRNWKLFDTGAYNAIGAAGSDALWAVGPKGRVGRLRFE